MNFSTHKNQIADLIEIALTNMKVVNEQKYIVNKNVNLSINYITY